MSLQLCEINEFILDIKLSWSGGSTRNEKGRIGGEKLTVNQFDSISRWVEYEHLHWNCSSKFASTFQRNGAMRKNAPKSIDLWDKRENDTVTLPEKHFIIAHLLGRKSMIPWTIPNGINGQLCWNDGFWINVVRFDSCCAIKTLSESKSFKYGINIRLMNHFVRFHWLHSSIKRSKWTLWTIHLHIKIDDWRHCGKCSWRNNQAGHYHSNAQSKHPVERRMAFETRQPFQRKLPNCSKYIHLSKATIKIDEAKTVQKEFWRNSKSIEKTSMNQRWFQFDAASTD